MFLVKLRLALFVALTTVGVGAGALAYQTSGKQADEQRPTSAAKAPEQQTRTDLHGDPLPPHAIARLGTLRFRGARGCLAFSPDGKLLASAAGRAGEHVALWDTATGRKIRQIAGTDSLMQLAFSPDGRQLAITDIAIHCRVVDTDTGKVRFTLPGLHGTFSADGKIVVTGTTEGLAGVRAWDAATGKGILEGFPARVQELAVIGDGRTVVMTDQKEPSVVKVVDLTKGKLIRSFRLAWVGEPKLTLTADGKSLASADINRVRLWDMANGKRIGIWHCRNLSGAAVFSPDGKRLAWTSQDEKGGSLRLWVVERDGGKPRVVGAPVQNFETPCFSPDGKRLAVLTDAGVLSLRNVADGKEVPSFDAPNRPVIDLTFTTDGNQVVSRSGDEVFVWQTRTGKLQRRGTLLPEGHEYLVPLLPGGYLLTGERTGNPLQGRLWLRDMRTGANIQRFEGWMDGGSPAAVAAPGGRFVAVRGRAGELRVLDVRQRRCVYRCDPGGAASGLKLSANGEVLVWYRRVGKEIEVHIHHHTANKTIVLRDLPNGDRVKFSLDFCLDNYSCLPPDGRWLLLPIEENRLRRWDMTTGKEASPLTETLATTVGITWSPDGRFAAVKGITITDFGPPIPSELRVWDTATGARLRQLVVKDISWTSGLFTHDSRTMVTGMGPRIQLWEVATGQERCRLQGDLLSGIDSLALSADGRMLASGDHGSEALVWDLTGRMPDGRWRTTSNSPEQRRAAWETLASGDAKAAYRGIWQLVADPEGTIALLRERVRPVARPEPAQVARWIADLDSPEFAERERAERALEARGETVAAEMRKTLTQKPSLEVRRRIEALLEKLHGLPQGRQLQALRALEVLEHLGTPEARMLLRKLAEGAAGARLTEQARETLNRLDERTAP